MNEKDFQRLAEKISNGDATEKDVALYNYYYNQFQQDAEWDRYVLGEKEELEAELHARITKELPEYSYKAKFRRIPYIKITVAAAILIALSVTLLTRNQEVEPSPVIAEQNRYEEDVDPGANKAILTLSDGTVLNLDESQEGLLAEQGSAQITKTEDGRISYTSSEKQSASKLQNLYNTITIPEGGQYRLTLPDGSKVWLNSSSTLKFPVAFTKESREVELEGEAYFEIVSIFTDNKKGIKKSPFLVKTPTQQIEVLGTQFNVNAYANEDNVKTTLIEGAVRISSTESGDKKTLKPGQQAQLINTGHISLLEGIDTEEAIAWKKGMFYFNNTDLSTIMKQLARWYKVDIDVPNMPQRKFNGELPRDVKLSRVLQMMEKTSGLKFKIEGRRISMVK